MSSNQLNDQHYSSDIKTLLEFINRLGSSVHGFSHEIDSKISRIKALSESGQVEIEQLKPLFSSVGLVLQKEKQRIEQTVSQAHHHAFQATQGLLDCEQLSSAEKEQVRALKHRIDAPLLSYTELLPLLSEIISLLQRRVTEPVAQSHADAAHINQLQYELSNILATVDFRGHASTSLQALKQRLLTPLDLVQLLESCMQALRLVLRGVNDERQSAQQFLLSLSDALDSVGKALSKAMHYHEQGADAQSELSKKLESQLHALSGAVQSATNLQDLKQQVHAHVTSIGTTLTHKFKLEQAERQRLHAQLLSMQSRLEDVESEALMYKRKLSEQKFKSLQDSLTRLPNRAAFEERLQLEYQRWQSYAAPLCIAVADIDNFKVINDTYGHTAGDKTLQVIANMLKKSLRETDFVCRYGGEEFVIIFPQTTLDVALELLEKARHRVKSIPFKFKQANISITISAGVSSFNTKDSPSRVFERADRALYQAKDAGRDRVCQL